VCMQSSCDSLRALVVKCPHLAARLIYHRVIEQLSLLLFDFMLSSWLERLSSLVHGDFHFASQLS